VHLINPRDVVPESNMPAYPWLATGIVNGEQVQAKMATLRIVGVPYSDEDIASAVEDLNGKTELEAMIAYLQSLGLAIKEKRS
jgi:cytochrome c oxidase cbb3-type subunit 2